MLDIQAFFDEASTALCHQRQEIVSSKYVYVVIAVHVNGSDFSCFS